jgi:hypothetical protein
MTTYFECRIEGYLLRGRVVPSLTCSNSARAGVAGVPPS